MALDQQKTIILLAAILLAVVATSITVLLLLPNGEEADLDDFGPVDTALNNQSSTFNLKVFDRNDYKALDQRLINENALPVQPPANIGKANPFL